MCRFASELILHTKPLLNCSQGACQRLNPIAVDDVTAFSPWSKIYRDLPMFQLARYSIPRKRRNNVTPDPGHLFVNGGSLEPIFYFLSPTAPKKFKTFLLFLAPNDVKQPFKRRVDLVNFETGLTDLFNIWSLCWLRTVYTEAKQCTPCD